MTNSDPSEPHDGLEIYKKLARTYKIAAIDRKITFKEAVFVPIAGEYASVGAAIFLAVLCYPESLDKRIGFVNAISCAFIKQTTKPRSPLRKELRDIPSFREMLDTPNKRIFQTLNAGLKRLHRRFRAAWVLLQKLTSSDDPDTQVSLRHIISVAAIQNTRAYPAFGSSKDDEEQIIDSFRQRIMNPSRPVIHLAMALYSFIAVEKLDKISLFNLVHTGQDWLPTIVQQAEVYRVMFGDWFPRYDSKHLPGRTQNFDAPPSKTIAVLPFIDPIDPSLGWEDFLMIYRIQGEST